MYKVLETDDFLEWLSGLKDLSTRIRLARRLDKARLGNLGDVKALTDGV
jgi:putative addiction module killer protein